MSCSISSAVNVAIMRELETAVESVGGHSTSDLDLYQIEDIIATVLSDMDWVQPEDVQECAEALAEDFEGIAVILDDDMFDFEPSWPAWPPPTHWPLVRAHPNKVSQYQWLHHSERLGRIWYKAATTLTAALRSVHQETEMRNQ